MEWVIILAIVAAYCGLSDKIKKMLKASEIQKREFPSLRELINKKIEIEIVDDYIKKGTIGILKKYDDTWIAIQIEDKKGRIKQNYFRLSNISSINILDK